MTDPMTADKQLEMLVGLHKFYLELMVDTALFAVAVIGGIASAVLLRKRDEPALGREMLLVTAAFAASLAVLAYLFTDEAAELRVWADQVASEARAHPPHVSLLSAALWWMILGFAAAAVMLVWMALRRSPE